MSQSKQILDHLLTGEPITPIEALNQYGVFRLSARCFDLREKGFDIQAKTINTGKKSYASYFMSDAEILRVQKLFLKENSL